VITDRRVASALLVFTLVFTTCSPAMQSGDRSHERDPYALLFGTVFGPNERPLYGVRIKIRRADQKKARWELISNHTGEFAQRVPAGKADYIITAEVKSKGAPKQEITVHVDNDERKDFTLHLK
jgi:hypothetical protein